MSLSMASDLRRRSPQQQMNSSGSNELSHVPAFLQTGNMMRASPQHHGPVHKLHVNPLYLLLPRWIQEWMHRFLLCFKWVVPQWKSRYLILLGSYVYKFTDLQTKAGPKGSPIRLESADIYLVVPGNDKEEDIRNQKKNDEGFGDDISWIMMNLPGPDYAVFCVSTNFSKKQYFATSSHEEAVTWVNALKDAREEAMKRGMGHAPSGSFPVAWERYDRLGEDLMHSKARIRAKVQDYDRREMEMSTFGSAGVYG